jgi:hypothetical protein
MMVLKATSTKLIAGGSKVKERKEVGMLGLSVAKDSRNSGREHVRGSIGACVRNSPH